MARAFLRVFFGAAALVLFTATAAREDEKDQKSEMLVSVSPTSFGRVAEHSEAKRAENSALAELHAEPAVEPSHEAFVRSHAKEQPTATAKTASNLSLDDVASADIAATAWKSAAQSTMQLIAHAATGLSVVGDDSKALRKAVANMGLDLGIEEAQRKKTAESKQKLNAEELEEQKLQPKKKFQDYARDSHEGLEHAHALEHQMEESLARLNSATAVTNSHESEDAQFAQLEKETENVMDMFNKIKRLRAVGLEVKSKRDTLLKEAADSGLSEMQIQVALKQAQEEAKRRAEIAAEQAQIEKTDQLRNLLASSAIEMAHMQSAATDVIEGMDAVTAWKRKQNNSAESLAEAAAVKARLSNAMKYLEEHENAVSERSQEINDLMGKVHLGSFGHLPNAP